MPKNPQGRKMNDRSPTIQRKLIKGVANTFETGAIRERSEKALIVKGSVVNRAAKVIAQGSTTSDLKKDEEHETQDSKRGIKRSIPKVEHTERRNEREKALVGIKVIITITTTPSADKA